MSFVFVPSFLLKKNGCNGFALKFTDMHNYMELHFLHSLPFLYLVCKIGHFILFVLSTVALKTPYLFYIMIVTYRNRL